MHVSSGKVPGYGALDTNTPYTHARACLGLFAVFGFVSEWGRVHLLWWLQISYSSEVNKNDKKTSVICNFQPFDDSSGVPDP